MTKQASIITPEQQQEVLEHIQATRRHSTRDATIFLLSILAGLRACEISNLTWSMVCDGEGNLKDTLQLPDRATKGGKGGRTIPIHPLLKTQLTTLQEARKGTFLTFRYSDIAQDTIVCSERTWEGMSPGTIVMFFNRLYKELGYEGCSSHSGRRTFITRLAKKTQEAGSSLRDIQLMAGHSSLSTTQRYIQGDEEAQHRLVHLL